MFTTGPNGGLWSHFYLMHSCSSCSYWLCCFISLLGVLCSCLLSHSQNLHQQRRSPFDPLTDTRASIHFVESLLLEFCTLLPPPELVPRLLQSWLLSPSPAFHLTRMLDPRFKDPKSSRLICPWFILESSPWLSTELGCHPTISSHSQPPSSPFAFSLCSIRVFSRDSARHGHELGQTLGDSEGQGGLACCSPRGCKKSDTT